MGELESKQHYNKSDKEEEIHEKHNKKIEQDLKQIIAKSSSSHAHHKNANLLHKRRIHTYIYQMYAKTNSNEYAAAKLYYKQYE